MVSWLPRWAGGRYGVAVGQERVRRRGERDVKERET